MTRYADDSRDRVFEAVDMVRLMSDRGIELRRQGVNSYFGNCPFHDERTDSFHVSPDERLYHCFGCQASGDAFKFVMETEGVDFVGALESLASRFGVALETRDENPEAAARRERFTRLTGLLDRTATFYARYLWESAEAAEARDYLRGRGLAEEVLREFRVGFSPGTSWDRIIVISRKAGFSEQELLDVGLAVRSRRQAGTVYDQFRGQIMFPAADERGRVRGFGARRLRDDPGPDGRPRPKYVNTADGTLYHKREVLFGVHLARGPAAKAGRMILAEGYTDVLALHQAGIRNAVGIMGTVADQRAGRDAGEDRRHRRAVPRRRQRRTPGDAEGGPGGPGSAASCAWSGCPKALTRRIWSPPRAPKGCRRGSSARFRSSSSRSTGSSPTATSPAPRDATWPWPSWRRCWRRWGRARCATS